MGDAIRPANNLDAMRLAAALAVIIGHSYTLTGVMAPRVFGVPIHNLGLYAFFAISGYLIATSWQRNPNLPVYLASRSLRIFPALIVVVLATAFLIGPAVSVLGVGGYFRSSTVYEYLLNIVLLAQYELPGVFETGHTSSAVNGVLWTLGLEFACYLIVAAIGVALRRQRMWGFVGFGLVAVAGALMPSAASELAWMGPAATTWVFFAVGALLSGVPRRMFAVRSLLVVIPVWASLAALVPSVALPLSWLALPVVVMVLGLASTPGIRAVGRFGDLSYGTYLWGFLVQQLVIEWFDPLPVPVNLALVFALTGVCAFASWHLVERHALALKSRLPAGAPRAATAPVVRRASALQSESASSAR